MRLGIAPHVACLAVVAMAALACRGSAPADPASGDDEVRLPGVDTTGFTPREKHELSRYVKELPSPCPSVAVPVSQCILERRPCSACLPAAQAVAKAVREGLAEEQVRELYKRRFDPSTVRSIPTEGSPSRGPTDAAVTVVEFADFECPFCQKLAPELDELWEKRKMQVRFVYKFLPLSMHPHGESAARAAIAAYDQGKFWEMAHQLFANGTHLEDADLHAYAKAVGLDVPRFDADLRSPATQARLDADRRLADDLGVKGTPTIFIDGRQYEGRLDLDEWVDTEIAAARKN